MPNPKNSLEPIDWLNAAKTDLEISQLLSNQAKKHFDKAIAYHLQQSAEKSTKAVVLNISKVYPLFKKKSLSMSISIEALHQLLPKEFIDWFQNILEASKDMKTKISHDPVERLFKRDYFQGMIYRFKTKIELAQDNTHPQWNLLSGKGVIDLLRKLKVFYSIIGRALNQRVAEDLNKVLQNIAEASKLIDKIIENRDTYLHDIYLSGSQNFKNPQNILGFKKEFIEFYLTASEYAEYEMEISQGTGLTEVTTSGFDQAISILEYFMYLPLISFLTPFNEWGRYPMKQIPRSSLFSSLEVAIENKQKIGTGS